MSAPNISAFIVLLVIFSLFRVERVQAQATQPIPLDPFSPPVVAVPGGYEPQNQPPREQAPPEKFAVELGDDGLTTVRGIVYEAIDYNNPGNRSVGGAMVVLVPATPSAVPLKTTADAQGLFEFVFARNGEELFTLFAIDTEKNLMGNTMVRPEDYPGGLYWSADGAGPFERPTLKDFRGRLAVRFNQNAFRTTGTVKDVSGKPVLGALIQASEYIAGFRSVSDSEGKFEYYTPNNSPPHSICAFKPNVGLALLSYVGGKITLEQARESNPFYRPIELVLAPVTPLRLLITDKRDMPVADCQVTAYVQDEFTAGSFVPFVAATEKNGIARIDWMPKDSKFQVDFVVKPPNELRRYADGSAANLMSETRFSTKDQTAGQLQCVIPYKAEMKVKIANPFADAAKNYPFGDTGKPERLIPFVNFTGDYRGWSSPSVFRVPQDQEPSSRNDSVYEFTLYSVPGQPYWLGGRLDDGESAVFPMVHSVFGDGFTPQEISITLRKGTPLRVRLLDEAGNRVPWEQYRYSATIYELNPAAPEDKAHSVFYSYDFSDSMRKSRNANTSEEELVCYLPPGRFRITANYVAGILSPQMQMYVPLPPRDPNVPVVLQKSIPDNEKTITVPDEPDGKEIIVEFLLVDPNVQRE